MDRIEITADRATTIADDMKTRSDRNQLARARLTSIASTVTGTEDVPQSPSAFDATTRAELAPATSRGPGALPSLQEDNTR